MESPMFRKVALERLSSPEQLDQAVRVTNPQGWIALIAFGAVILAAAAWGIIGEIPIQVSGTGILLRKGGVYSVFSGSSGMVVEVAANRNTELKVGSVVVKIAQPDVVKNVEDAKDDLTEAQEHYDEALQNYNQGLSLGLQDLKRQRDYLTESIKITKTKLQNLEERINNLSQLLSKGLINKDVLDSTEDEKHSSEQTLSQYQNQLKQLETQEFDLKNQKENTLEQARLQLVDAKNRLSTLELQLSDTTLITTPYEGVVTAVLVEKGNVISPGTPVIQLEVPQKDLSAVLYVSPVDGKKVQPGMAVQLSPANVKQEEYGYIMAKVVSVSVFPAPRQQMQALLQNDDLVQQFSSAGNPYEVEVALETDATTQSGFLWSSRRDPPFQISSGTLCFGHIVVTEKRPISMVIPYIKEKTGI